jgi:YHS domain-containing protein
MNLIRRSAWAVVMLGAVAGCTGGEETTPPAGGPTTKPAPSGERRPAKVEPGKETPSKEMLPPPPPPLESKPGEDTKKAGPALQGPAPEGKAEPKKDTAAVKLTPDEIATIKKLPEADQGPALAQAVCPVSDGRLGQMGMPVKVSVEGKSVFLCCEDCEKEIKADPKKYLAKLDATASKK